MQTKDKSGRLIVGAGVGIGVDTIERVSALVEAGVDIIAVDSAHGHSKGVLDKIKEIRQNFPDLDIVGGNIVTAEAAEDLIKAGAKCAKSRCRAWFYLYYESGSRSGGSAIVCYI